jgi:UPF0755 protein
VAYDEQTRIPSRKARKTRRSAFSRVVASLLLLSLAAILIAGAAAIYGYNAYTSPGPLAQNKVYMIAQGNDRAEIARALAKEGIIDNAPVFTAAAYLDGFRGRVLKAGEYEFPARATMEQVLDLLASGKSISYKVTVPEGWTAEMAVARINENDILTGDPAIAPAEGLVMPDTYVFHRGMTRQKLVEDMKAAQAKLIDELWEKRATASPIKTKEEAVTLASIVEKETGVAAERPMVASVFINRLKQGMRLQSDPTIIYGLVGGKGKLDRALTKDDLASDTPYNTYKIAGLPPGPIANPGRAAIEAVLNPPDTGYLYFVANGTGGHAFAKTLAEHNANVVKWRAIEGGQAAVVTTEAPTEVVVDGMPTPSTPKPAPTPEATDQAASAVPQPDAATSSQQPPAAVATAPAPAPTAETPAAAPADAAVATTTVLQPGTVVKVADRLVPIPRQKPKQ